MAVHVKWAGLDLIQTLYNHNTARLLRRRCWSNLIVLNEWQRRFAEASPVDLHQRLWQTKLVCPGGGRYVWNEALQSTESTVFGCPARPKTPADLPNTLKTLRTINMGLTFEEDGLRARAEVER